MFLRGRGIGACHSTSVKAWPGAEFAGRLDFQRDRGPGFRSGEDEIQQRGGCLSEWSAVHEGRDVHETVAAHGAKSNGISRRGREGRVFHGVS